MSATIALVDWGTTSFRLWLVNENGQLLAARKSRQGMATAMQEGFPQVLDEHLRLVSADERTPVLICGMAGAKSGWVEAGYLDCPAALSNISAGAVRVPGQSRIVRILPGIAKRTGGADVIRGEETTMLGAAAEGLTASKASFCLPGTHSKWIVMEGQTIIDFATFMTGELYEAISLHTILKLSLGEPADGMSFDADGLFGAAVRQAASHPDKLTNHLFTIRGQSLLSDASDRDLRETLSGYLIGSEIAGASPAGPVNLVAAGDLKNCYEAAFAALDIAFKSYDAEELVIEGLKAAFAQLQQNKGD